MCEVTGTAEFTKRCNTMIYTFPPDPDSIDWRITEAGHSWKSGEVAPRFELTPEKLEMVDGKLLSNEAARLRLLGLLLENCGAEAAVRMGDPEVWRRAVASLSDSETNFRIAVQSSLRRRGEFDPHDREGAIAFYQQVTTENYIEDVADNETVSRNREECIAYWTDLVSERSVSQDYTITKSSIIRLLYQDQKGWAQIEQVLEHHRYQQVSPNVHRGSFIEREAIRWQEEWQLTLAGWRLKQRKFVERTPLN